MTHIRFWYHHSSPFKLNNSNNNGYYSCWNIECHVLACWHPLKKERPQVLLEFNMFTDISRWFQIPTAALLATCRICVPIYIPVKADWNFQTYKTCPDTQKSVWHPHPPEKEKKTLNLKNKELFDWLVSLETFFFHTRITVNITLQIWQDNIEMKYLQQQTTTRATTPV